MFANWFTRIPGLKRILSRPERRRMRLSPVRRLLMNVEALEDRVVPATILWTGAAGNNLWSTPGNWSSGTVPTSADNVFNSLSSQIQVGSAAAAKTLDFTGGTAQLRILSAGSLTLGSAAADASSLNNGLVLDSGGTITATGTVALGGSSTFSGGTINGGTIASGAVTGGLHLSGSATHAAGVVTLNGNMAVESGGSYFISVANAHAVAGGGTLLVRNGGTLNASGVTIGIDHLVNDGTTSISSGTFLTVVNAHTHAGAFAVTGALAFTGNTTFASGSSFSGTGSVDFGNRFITVQSSLTINNVNSSGTIDVASGRTFTFAGNSTTTNVGLAGVGGFANTGALSVAGTSAALTTTLSNSGTITQTVGTLRLGGATITNQAAGTYILSGNSLINNNISGVSAFNNSGILRKSGGGVSELLGVLSLNNSGGTLDAVSGTLNFPGGHQHRRNLLHRRQRRGVGAVRHPDRHRKPCRNRGRNLSRLRERRHHGRDRRSHAELPE